MARITQDQIEQINEVYAQCGVKTQTAKIVGVSVASVTKYLIPNYIPRAQRETYTFEKEIIGFRSMLEIIDDAQDKIQSFIDLYELTQEEWNDLKELQKEVF